MKIKNSIILTAILFSLCNLQSYCQQIILDPSIRTGKLANGLTYFIKRNNMQKGKADFHLAQKVGSVLEEDNQRGLAHFLEHMAFNGTKHFPGNTMITELEKKGIKFGANINAYTGYDETVYRLTNIPVSRESMLDTALLVLNDWSGFILNEDKDIDDERAIIREEWRTRSSANLRIQESQVLPELFEGTRYATRLPIGTMDVVMNFKYQQLKDYYQKWYRPDLQGIIIVGDVDVDLVENKVKTLFGSIPTSSNPVKPQVLELPKLKEPIVIIASDPEVRNATATIYWPQGNLSSKSGGSIQYLKEKVINSLISNIINNRFSELKKREKRSWSSFSIMSSFSVAKNIPAWSLDINVPDSQIMKALKLDLIEMERIRRFGFSKNELDPTVREFHILENESSYYDLQQMQNSEYAAELIKQFLNGEVTPEKSFYYSINRKFLKELTVDTLNFYVKKYLNFSPPAITLTLPKKEAVNFPTKSNVERILSEIGDLELKPYNKETEPNDFENLVIPKGGKIVKTDSDSKPFGYTKWTLSNGMNVWFKNTGYKESKISFFGFKIGGYSQIDLQRLPSALAYNQVINQSNGLYGAIGVVYKEELNPYNAYVLASAPKIQLTKLFQSVYIKMSKVTDDFENFRNWQSIQLERIKSKGILPKNIFGDTLRAIMSNQHPRSLSINDPKIFNQVSYEEIKRLNKEFFGNAKDFNIIITGNVDIDTVKYLVKTWLGGIPSKLNSISKVIDHNIYPPKGIIKRQFQVNMVTPQSTITTGYTGEIPTTLENRELFSIITDLLKRRYIQEIREKEGGTYGVGVFYELYNLPIERYIIQINYDTAPDKEKQKKLLNIVYNEIEKLKTIGPTNDELNSILVRKIKDAEEYNSHKNAEYWHSKQSSYLYYKNDYNRDIVDVLKVINSNKIKEFANLIFGQGNLIEVIMDPLVKL